jgi:RNA polymerase sigma factor (TIGR02999 family)
MHNGTRTLGIGGFGIKVFLLKVRILFRAKPFGVRRLEAVNCRSMPGGQANEVLEADLSERSADEIFEAVYQELRQMAARQIAGEQPGQTLQATALVHEVWLRFSRNGAIRFENPSHFFGAAAEAMRRILVEKARRKQAAKRGGGAVQVELSHAEHVANDEDDRVLQVHSALDELAAADPIEAEVVKLRFFAGLGNEEVAALLGVNERTVRRYWTHAKAWLYLRIRGEV